MMPSSISFPGLLSNKKTGVDEAELSENSSSDLCGLAGDGGTGG